MAGQRQPIDLVIAKGKKHLTKAEIAERKSSEVQPCDDEIAAPSFLTAKQKKDFNKIAAQLQKLNVMGETDCDALARYITAQGQYEQTIKDIRAVQKERPKCADVAEIAKWTAILERLDQRLDRYFKQAQTAANALGLTISSRCRLVAPVVEEKPKENKFAKFSGGRAAGNE